MADQSDKPSGAGYAVGYGKPPAQHRFKPGQSGNPKGRSKAPKSVAELFVEEAARTVQIKQGGKVEIIAKHRAVIRALLNSALHGDVAAMRLLFAVLQTAPSPAAGVGAEPLSSVERAILQDAATLQKLLDEAGHE